ncbi:MAG: regulatory protein GemA [Caulobacter sp.]|nr:regulatory protein GemA [Caulobacter sp.]
MLRVAKERLGLSEDDYRALLENYGGVSSATELDKRGFAAVMDRFRDLGFVTPWWTRNFGVREGMASPAQVELIRALWQEVEGGDERHLNSWLAKYHKIGALRFATVAKAGQVIDALKKWKARLERPGHGD